MKGLAPSQSTRNDIQDHSQSWTGAAQNATHMQMTPTHLGGLGRALTLSTTLRRWDARHHLSADLSYPTNQVPVYFSHRNSYERNYTLFILKRSDGSRVVSDENNFDNLHAQTSYTVESYNMEARGRIPVDLPHPYPTASYWQDPPDHLSDYRSSDSLPLQEFDHIIVGSGISGTCIAYNILCQQPDAKVLMLEARQACSGATGRNGSL